MTVPPPTPATSSFPSLMILLWRGSSLGGKSPHTRMRCSSFHCGAAKTTCPWTLQTKQLNIDFRRKRIDIQPPFIGMDCVERVSDFWFLGVHIEDDLTWSINTTAVWTSFLRQTLQDKESTDYRIKEQFPRQSHNKAKTWTSLISDLEWILQNMPCRMWMFCVCNVCKFF